MGVREGFESIQFPRRVTIKEVNPKSVRRLYITLIECAGLAIYFLVYPIFTWFFKVGRYIKCMGYFRFEKLRDRDKGAPCETVPLSEKFWRIPPYRVSETITLAVWNIPNIGKSN